MRVALLAFLHESNTFLPQRTTYQDFARNSLTTGLAMLQRWGGVQHEIGGMIAQCARSGVEIAGGFAALGAPSATIDAASFERIAREMLAELRACGPVNGVLVALHGATVSENFPDADGEILLRIRNEVGENIPVIGTLDLHANVSRKMVRYSDALTAYRTNPHLDQYDRGVEAAMLMHRTLSGEVQPVQRLVTPPMLIPMSCQYTAEDPARALYEELSTALELPHILSASICMGFPYADVEEVGASFLAVSDKNDQAAEAAAMQMASRTWARRSDFSSVLPNAEVAVARAIASTKPPVVLLDIGDNVGGGSAADSTTLMAEVIRQKGRGALVVLHDEEAVRACVKAGVRSDISLSVGGKCDAQTGPPIVLSGRVQTLSDGIFTETNTRHGGWGKMDQGITAVVVTEEDHTVVLTSNRMPPFSLEQLLSLGIHPERKHILIVKGVIAPRAAYDPVAGETLLVDTPGATTDDPARLAYRNRRSRLYPMETAARFEATP